jgi:hypothetical protein
MRRCNAILLLGLLSWAEPVSAQTVHRLTVGIHDLVSSDWGANPDEKAKIILKKNSNTLQQHGCPDVGFELKGEVTKFTSAPVDIVDAPTLEQVHLVPFDVKVVRSIAFCVGQQVDPTKTIGCSWRPEGRRTVIVTSLGSTKEDNLAFVLWAHEFGHTTGLLHRNHRDNLNLMSPCGLRPFNRHVNKKECRHFLAGPVQDPPSGLGPACRRNRR